MFVCVYVCVCAFDIYLKFAMRPKVIIMGWVDMVCHVFQIFPLSFVGPPFFEPSTSRPIDIMFLFNEYFNYFVTTDCHHCLCFLSKQNVTMIC